MPDADGPVAVCLQCYQTALPGVNELYCAACQQTVRDVGACRAAGALEHVHGWPVII
jgi:hypothetical protein